jgi:adenylate cyclase
VVARQLVYTILGALGEVAGRHGGRVIKTIGDEVMSVFPDAAGCAQAAREIQMGVRDMPAVDGTRLGVRIGFHYGPMVEKAGDVFGDSVNLSARLTELASRGQIITSLETVELLPAALRMDCRRLYSIPVKGRDKEVDICEVMWADTDDATTVVTAGRGARAQRTLKLKYAGREVVLGRERRSCVLGRDAGVDLVVADKMASRAHCEIEQRQDKFMLVDRSANGTFLTIDGDQEMVLRREEAMLRGHGFITLGQSRSTTTEVVEFFCE